MNARLISQHFINVLFLFAMPDYFSALLTFLLLVPTLVHADWYKQQEAIMGTAINVELWQEGEIDGPACASAVMQEMRRIDALMSPFRPDTELARLNREAWQRPVKVSRELFQLISQSLKISQLSNGAFDITFASIGLEYDYRNRVHPSDREIAARLAKINYHHLLLDRVGSRIKFARKGVKVDLGGIAKGYAVDNGIRILKDCGVRYGLVTAGGDSRILGDKRGRPWMMGIRSPRDRQGVAVALPLVNSAISTSGDYERFFIEDGVRYHHIINPDSGKSVAGIQSVTVIGPDAVTTDALSTTFFVLGVKKALKLADSLQAIDTIIIDSRGQMHYSSGLMKPRRSAGEH